jgi:hypothetical protein
MWKQVQDIKLELDNERKSLEDKSKDLHEGFSILYKTLKEHGVLQQKTMKEE